MPISFTGRVNDRDLRDLQTTIGRAPRALERAVRAEILPKVETFALERLRFQPQQSALPFVWSRNPVKQARARAWYFANKVAKGSKGGRYRRTGKLREAWVVAYNPLNGTILLRNDSAGAEYVQSNRQVPSHRLSGWITVQTVRTGAAKVAEQNLRRVWERLTGVQR
jgi:hypothetical protein